MPAADHRDVHFRARNEAQIGVAGMRRTRRQLELQDEFSLGQRRAAGRGRHLLDRHFAFAAGADDHRDRTGGEQRRDAVGGGRGVAQIAGQRSAALDLRRTDQVHRFHHAGPGLLQRLIGLDHRAGRGGTDREAFARAAADADEAGQLLGIDNQVRPEAAGTKLHQQIGATRQNLHSAGGSGKQFDGLVHGRRCCIIETCHNCSQILRSRFPGPRRQCRGRPGQRLSDRGRAVEGRPAEPHYPADRPMAARPGETAVQVVPLDLSSSRCIRCRNWLSWDCIERWSVALASLPASARAANAIATVTSSLKV